MTQCIIWPINWLFSQMEMVLEICKQNTRMDDEKILIILNAKNGAIFRKINTKQIN